MDFLYTEDTTDGQGSEVNGSVAMIGIVRGLVKVKLVGYWR